MVRILVIYDNYNFSSPIEYTLGMIFSIYGVNYCIMAFKQFKSYENNLERTLVISYGREYIDAGARKQIHIYASDFFGKNYLKANSMPRTPLEKYDNVPVIYSGSGDFDGWVRKSEKLIETNIDIIAASFFMISRYEEVVINAKDQYDRFPVGASLAYREGFLDRPIVNEYIELLWSWMHSLNPELIRKPLWPDKKDFAICLTHDVDCVKKYSLLPPLRSVGSAILRHGNLCLGFNIAIDYLGTLFHFRKDPFDTFNYMLDLEQNYGFKPSFFFLAGKESKFHNSYSVTHPGVMSLINKLEARGCELGLHAGYDSYDNLDIMSSEKNEMDKVVRNKSYGCRQHALRWKTPNTWKIQEKTGLLYDTTLSFAGHAGFRCGICLPFQTFDVIENRKISIWELPLTVMDRSLQSPNYQNLHPDAAHKQIIKYIKTVGKFRGVLVLLWHNSSFDPLGGWGDWKEVYEGIIEYSSKQNAFVASAREVIKWWQHNLSLR
jgi:peptidoglycan/xylan/chitin deacetylase (PgdA/CDA1 family)